MGPVFNSSWLFGIARNTCLDQFRKCARQQRHQEAVKLFVPSQREDRTVSVALEQIFSLSEVFRKAFVLVRLMGFSYDEAAAIIGCPRGTVQSRVARARESLMLSALDELAREVS